MGKKVESNTKTLHMLLPKLWPYTYARHDTDLVNIPNPSRVIKYPFR